jgi:hypothetical protein
VGVTFATSSAVSWLRARLWLAAWIIASIAYAVPLAWNAYNDVVQVNYRARARLIEQHRLWEVDNFRGKPQNWTRFAARILTDQQLLRRVAMKYGGQSEEIEREYRRDLTIARAEVFIVAGAWWAGPVAGVYGLMWLVRRRRRPAPPAKVQPASASDPRSRPPT